jgi:hypothetical protein
MPEKRLILARYFNACTAHRVNTDVAGGEVSNAQLVNLVKLIVEAKTDSGK